MGQKRKIPAVSKLDNPEYMAALEAGLNKWYESTPCGRGHIGYRYIKDRSCLQCQELLMYKYKLQKIFDKELALIAKSTKKADVEAKIKEKLEKAKAVAKEHSDPGYQQLFKELEANYKQNLKLLKKSKS
jgi:hypothetical protein